MLVSGGDLVLSDTTPSFARTTYMANTGLDLSALHASYGAIYRAQLWVFVVVSKRARAIARLPLKVYRRTATGGREPDRTGPYARILANPNPKMDSKFFWLWVASTIDVYGEAMCVKIRGKNGRPAELWPMHPSLVQIRRVPDEATGAVETFYAYLGGTAVGAPVLLIAERDVVHFKTYNPDTTARGMSPLEPLRQTLVNEDAARRATSSFWARGARPGTALVHPGNLSQPAADRLIAQFDAQHAGVDNTGRTLLFEEGMEPKKLDLTAEEAQYIETRKLNREEVCAAYDVPPPVVHILDRATFSNITEQMRSMYRDTMAPPINAIEATLNFSLRPDFADEDTYAEFLMDEVLRGSFEERAEKIQAAVNSAQLTPNEGRAFDNRPALAGGDRLFINSTMIPIEATSARTSPTVPASDEHLSTVGTNPPKAPASAQPKPTGVRRWAASKAVARAGRCGSLVDVDPETLVRDLNGDARTVRALLEQSKAAGDDVATFCALVWALSKEEHV